MSTPVLNYALTGGKSYSTLHSFKTVQVSAFISFYSIFMQRSLIMFLSMGSSCNTRNNNTSLTRKHCQPQYENKILKNIEWPVLLFSTIIICWLTFIFNGCSSGGSSAANVPTITTIIVNSLQDEAEPTLGTMTLRAAIAQIPSGGQIIFDPSLNGGTIYLSIIGESHTILKGEVYSGMTFSGYQDRDYGKSALYASKNLTIDASSLPNGITIKWNGGSSNHARVLAVYGNLNMNNVAISSGYSQAEIISSGTQPYTLGRGGGLAVWGIATLNNCTIAGNTAEGDLISSRDRGTYGGGIYANGLIMQNCIISGNTAIGYGAAGGGIYSVGGADNTTGIGNDVSITRSVISGNRVTAKHAYGGGIFSLSGGPNNRATMYLINCTIARNLVEDNTNPVLAGTPQYYYRGGGVYLGGGSISIQSCTIAENQVNGIAAMFSGKPNMGGGGIASTIGNAHVVEYMKVWHSIIVGNTMNSSSADLFSGSLLHFYSYGYNLIGSIDFSQILVPAPPPYTGWLDLSRKHFPKEGDSFGVVISSALDITNASYHSSIISEGTDAGGHAILWYPPAGSALNQIPKTAYNIVSILGGYTGYGNSNDNFLKYVLDKLHTYGITTSYDDKDMTGTTWYGPSVTWPTDPQNADWISFWRNLDIDVGSSLGPGKINDDFWSNFNSGYLDFGNSPVVMTITTETQSVILIGSDQKGNYRPLGTKGDIGAIEN